MQVIHVGLIHGSPIFAVGLRVALAEWGLNVVLLEGADADVEVEVEVDVFLIDQAAVRHPEPYRYFEDLAWVAPVLCFRSEGSVEPQLRGSVHGFLDRNASVDDIVHAIMGVLGSADRRQGFAPRRADTAQLSPRELEVLRYIATGLIHSQIATRLSISPHTVDTYVKRIRAKMGVGNKAELTRIALISIPSQYPTKESGDGQ